MVIVDMDTEVLIVAGIFVALVLAGLVVWRFLRQSKSSSPEVRIHFDQYKGREQSSR